jgi:hypothetical protein
MNHFHVYHTPLHHSRPLISSILPCYYSLRSSATHTYTHTLNNDAAPQSRFRQPTGPTPPASTHQTFEDITRAMLIRLQPPAPFSRRRLLRWPSTWERKGYRDEINSEKKGYFLITKNRVERGTMEIRYRWKCQNWSNSLCKMAGEANCRRPNFYRNKVGTFSRSRGWEYSTCV